jgi:hypothetical protein
MPKKNSENFLVRPDIKQGAVETQEPTKNRLAGQEGQVGMAGPYTAKIICQLNQASLRMESSRQTEQRKT